jgi:hypothetical protein
MIVMAARDSGGDSGFVLVQNCSFSGMLWIGGIILAH